ncbi:hypothetical protein [Azohydromonas aeria]|uniref:hypothetical protein n=1 Tax=Azohydromonas aeria TaxID=2590212 RepID=UPI0012F97B60|nr:hypothetical protein [Azohydromonas aeria]
MSLNRLLARPVRRAALALCAAAVLTACGGGDRAEPFDPDRLVAFGDELSVLTPADASDPVNKPAGRKYSVNYYDTSTKALVCTSNPIWVQRVASHFDMAFEQCPNGLTTFRAVSKAVVGARVQDLEAQVQAFLSTGNPNDKDVVTMLVGFHDLEAVYAAHASDASSAAAEKEMADLGERLAKQVYDVSRAGPAVLLALMPAYDRSPWARDVVKNPDRVKKLVTAFNEGLQSGGPTPGEPNSRKGIGYYKLKGDSVGLVNLSLSWIESVARNSEDRNKTALCPASTPLPDCDNRNLANDNNEDNWVWADATHPGPGFHDQVGAQATTLAERNPF